MGQSAQLLFHLPPVPCGALLFGEEVEAAGVALAVTGRFPPLRVRVQVGAVEPIQVRGSFAPLRARVYARYRSDTQRPIVSQSATPWQVAAAITTPAATLGQQAARPLPQDWHVAHQEAQHLLQSVQHRLPKVLTPLQPCAVVRHQDGLRLGTVTDFVHQHAQRTSAPTATRYQEAQRTQTATDFAHQDATHTHGIRTARYQTAKPLVVRRMDQWRGRGAARGLHWDAHHQEAVAPRPGLWIALERPKPPPCYVPSAELLFDANSEHSAQLLFACEGKSPTPTPGGETVIVPIKKVYIVLNQITLTRVDSGTPLHALSFSASLDMDSWTWQWSASLHESAQEHLGRDSGGAPAEVLASINGRPLRLRIERVQLQEQFLPQKRFAVSGRGRAAILGAPYAPALTHGGQAAARTAQQIAQEVLMINGVGIGWSVDWGTEDWPVPPGVWTHYGPYIDALSDIAGAVGAYIQPHPTDAVLRFLPKYPAAPWNWGTLTPDYQIPTVAAQTLGTEYLDKPAYNGVYVGGTQAGVFGPVLRGGTVGEALAPQCTHPLITDATAQRLRGLAELSDTGRQRRVQLSMQVLPETGLIEPGKLVQVGAGASAYRGLVRATAIEWAMPRLRQNIQLEVHE